MDLKHHGEKTLPGKPASTATVATKSQSVPLNDRDKKTMGNLRELADDRQRRRRPRRKSRTSISRPARSRM